MCSCGNKARSNQRTCLSCHARYQREHRKTHKLSPAQKKKEIARAYTKVYLKRGKITKENCSVCGDLNSQIHHLNYDKPLLIQWLCRPCHLNMHKQIG